mmetsp:Transcript_733/g.741  ORF Transcript_733/g.741 Transcript_733/m.741 type:complete len:392 (+) Transcript_733:100-1275(+)
MSTTKYYFASGEDEDSQVDMSENESELGLPGCQIEAISHLRQDTKLQFFRERNRIHAKNTRDRKKMQMSKMEARMNGLVSERANLSKQLVDSTVAGILVSLSSDSSSAENSGVTEGDSSESSVIKSGSKDSSDVSNSSLVDAIKDVSCDLSDTEENISKELDLLAKYKSDCSPEELELIRRERNRVHAKKTRLRKKRMLYEMETNMSQLEKEVRNLRQKVASTKRQNDNRFNDIGIISPRFQYSSGMMQPYSHTNGYPVPMSMPSCDASSTHMPYAAMHPQFKPDVSMHMGMGMGMQGYYPQQNMYPGMQYMQPQNMGQPYHMMSMMSPQMQSQMTGVPSLQHPSMQMSMQMPMHMMNQQQYPMMMYGMNSMMDSTNQINGEKTKGGSTMQ